MVMHVAAFAALVTVAALGTVGNLFIIGAVCIHKRLRTNGHALVINLALADLIVTAYIMPMGLAASQYDDKPFGDLVCDITAFLVMCTLGVSTQTLMVIALERYFHVCKNHIYKKVFSKRLTTVYIIAIWLYSGIWTAQGFTHWSDYKYVATVYSCMIDAEKSLSYNVCVLVIGMLLPILVLVFSYVSIFCKVRQSRIALIKSTSPSKISEDNCAQSISTQLEQKFTIMLFIIVVVFIICWTPTGIVMTLSGAGISAPLILYPISVWLSFSNSSMNSVIYGVMNRNFRKGYLQICKHLLCMYKYGMNSDIDESDGAKCCCITQQQQQPGPAAGPATCMTTNRSHLSATRGNNGDIYQLSTISTPHILHSESLHANNYVSLIYSNPSVHMEYNETIV